MVVELPPDLDYKSRWMTVSVAPALQRRVIEMALGVGIVRTSRQRRLEDGSRPPAAAALGRDAGRGSAGRGQRRRVRQGGAGSRGRLSPSAVDRRSRLRLARRRWSSDASRTDGGWCWTGAKGSDWGASAISFWALAVARQQGVAVHEESFNKAKAYLQGMLAKLAANDNDGKAVVLHALSAAQAADFANVNRLYRERNELSPPALAYTALALANLNRPEIAKEVLAVLESKAKPHAADGRQLLRWDGSSAQPWLSDDLETTAVALLALVARDAGIAQGGRGRPVPAEPLRLLRVPLGQGPRPGRGGAGRLVRQGQVRHQPVPLGSAGQRQAAADHRGRRATSPACCWPCRPTCWWPAATAWTSA